MLKKLSASLIGFCERMIGKKKKNYLSPRSSGNY